MIAPGMSIMRSNKNKKYITNTFSYYYLNQNQKMQGITPSGRRFRHFCFVRSSPPSLSRRDNSKVRTRWVHFVKRKEKNPLEARGNAKWCGVVWSLPWQWISGIWGGDRCLCCWQAGERRALMGSVLISPCCVVLPVKNWEMANLSKDASESRFQRRKV